MSEMSFSHFVNSWRVIRYSFLRASAGSERDIFQAG